MFFLVKMVFVGFTVFCVVQVHQDASLCQKKLLKLYELNSYV